MIILALRTDKPEAELALYDDTACIQQVRWQAHRLLAETIHVKIDELLDHSNHTMDDVQGIACFKGPGSFTGLRIGLTVANALAALHSVPIVSDGSTDWQQQAIMRLQKNEDEQIAIPEYGAPATTTTPKK